MSMGPYVVFVWELERGWRGGQQQLANVRPGCPAFPGLASWGIRLAFVIAIGQVRGGSFYDTYDRA
jgi:hypothetical protein